MRNSRFFPRNFLNPNLLLILVAAVKVCLEAEETPSAPLTLPSEKTAYFFLLPLRKFSLIKKMVRFTPSVTWSSSSVSMLLYRRSSKSSSSSVTSSPAIFATMLNTPYESGEISTLTIHTEPFAKMEIDPQASLWFASSRLENSTRNNLARACLARWQLQSDR